MIRSIIGYGLSPKFNIIGIPDVVCTFDYKIYDRKWESISNPNIIYLDLPILVGGDQWIGIGLDKEVEVFSPDEEKTWRARTAQKAIQASLDPELRKKNPIQSVELLRGAGDLIGLNIASLYKMMETARASGKSLEQMTSEISDAFRV